MADKQFVNGIRVYKPRDNAPDFVIADVTINANELTEFIRSQGGDFRATIKSGKKGYYIEVNNYKGASHGPSAPRPYPADDGMPTDDLPF